MKRPLQAAATAAAFLSLALVAHGVRDVVRGGPLEVVRGAGPGEGPPAIGEPRFLTEAEHLGGVPLEPGNRVRVLIDGGGTFPPLWRDLRSATRSITFQVYYCEPGAVADTLAAILEERALAGVAVLFLADGFGCDALVDAHGERLRAAGARVALFRPVRWHTLHKAQHRSHARAVVVDGRIGYTGGFGIADAWYGGTRERPEWRETNARVTGPAVHHLQAAFAAAWAEATGELLSGAAFFGTGGEDPERGGAVEGVVAGVLEARPGLGSNAAERLLAVSIAGARKTLHITNSYFAPGPVFRELLKEAAGRGVDVRVLTAGRATDVPAVRRAGRAAYEELLEAGVRIYEYGPRMMHAKTLVADGAWTAIGSLNFDNRSLRLNDETALVAHDARLGAAMDSIFLEDLRHAEEVRLEAFRRRPWTERALELGARLVWPLL